MNTNFVLIVLLSILMKYNSVSAFIRDLPKITMFMALLFMLFLFTLYYYQNSLIYQSDSIPGIKTPSDNPPGLKTPKELLMDYEDIYFEAEDGVKLHSWFIYAKNKSKSNNGILMFFHGNAGNIGLRLPIIKTMWEKTNLNIFVLSYRGYGFSEGKPSEKGIKIDSISAINLLNKGEIVKNPKFYLYGISIGGAVAINLASQKKDLNIKGLIVENSFTSISDLVDIMYPKILKPFKPLILRNYWNSQKAISAIKAPIFFLSGQRDEIVPKEHMKILHKSATSASKKYFLPVEEGEHNTTSLIAKKIFWEKVLEFFEGFSN